MKQLLGIALLALLSMSPTRAEETAAMTGSGPTLSQQDVEKVAPALQAYAKNRLLDDVWKRPGLAPRDRSIVTLAALIARNQTVELAHHVDLAFDNGVKPREISEIITHLAFYAGWGNAMSAVAVVKGVCAVHKVGADHCRRCRRRYCRSTRLPRRSGKSRSGNSSVRRSPVWSNIRY